MANFQHLKASRTRVLDTFPTNSFGNNGDIVISRISGRGVFICTKAGGMWYVANQMQELARIGKATLKELNADKLTIKNIENAQSSIDSYIVSDLGNIKFKTGKQLVDDLPLPFNNISYKQAYCSLERYTDQETCEANGGTWYYSTNHTHDSISSTAENQLLTIGQMHNSVDTEPTLLYDGSVLEIKRYTDFDDNWQTSANIHTLKLSYNSSLNSTLGTDSSGNLRITSTSTHTSGTLLINNIEEIGSDTDKFLMSDSGVVKFVTGANLRSYIGAGPGDGDITGVSITTDTGAGSKAEDTGGSADFSILGSSGVDVTNSGTTITAVAVPAEIDHDSLNNFVANEHVDHTSVTLSAGDGLTGGGDISANRSFAVSVDDSTIEINSDSLRVKDDGITYSKLQNVTDARMLGNNAGSDGVVTEMTKANVLSFLNVADGAEVNVSGDSGNAAIYDNSGTPAFKSGITKAEVLSLLNVADGATANAGDVTLAGTQTITGVKTFNANVKIHGENSRFLYLDNGENVYINASSSTHLAIGVDGTDQITITDDKIEFGQNKFLIKERGTAGSDEASFGQIWVKNDTPNCLAFTDDAGTDIIGVGKYHYETKVMGFFAGQTTSFLPMTGYVIERTSTTASNEFIGYIAPYNCRLEKFCFRSEVAQNGSLTLRVIESSDGTEVPGTQIYRKDHTIDIADDTFLELDMTSPGIGSDFAPMTKGRIYAFQLTTPSNASDTNITMVFRHDITT